MITVTGTKTITNTAASVFAGSSALAGFGLEIMFCPLLYFAGLWLYPWVVALHLIAYPFYAGEANDFKWI